jgi:hypothetical protein
MLILSPLLYIRQIWFSFDTHRIKLVSLNISAVMNTTTLIIVLIGSAIVVFGGFFGTFALFQYFAKKATGIPVNTPHQPEQAKPEISSNQAEIKPRVTYKPYFGLKQILPVLSIGFICLVSALVFMSSLSPEPAFRFDSAGNPVSYGAKTSVVIISLIVQLIFIAISWSAGKIVTAFINRLGMPESSGQQSQKVISISANMIMLPQLIAAFISLDIFIYDIYKFHLLPVWAFAAITMVVGGILIIWRIRNIMRSNKAIIYPGA